VPALRRPSELWLLAAVGLSALWPVTARVASPWLLPIALVCAGIAAVALSRPEFGVAIVLAVAPLIDTSFPGLLGRGGLMSQPLKLLVPLLILGIAFCAALGAPRRTRGPVASPLVVFAPLAFMSLGLLSAMQAVQPSASINSVVVLVTNVLLYATVLFACRAPRQLAIVVTGALIGLFVAGVQGMLQKVLGLGVPYDIVAGGQAIPRVQGSFEHPNQFAVYLIALIPLALVVAGTRELRAPLRWLGAAAAAAAIPSVVFAYSRGALVGLVIGSLLWLLVLRPGRGTATAIAFAVLIVLFAPASLRDRFNTQTARTDVGLREALWHGAYDLASERPVLGVGPNNFAVAYGQLVGRRENGVSRPLLYQGDVFVLPSNGHNMYLNTLAEQGILGLLGLIVLGAVSLGLAFRGTRVIDPLGRAVSIGAGAGLLAWAVRGLTDAGLYGGVSVPLTVLVALSAVAVSREANAARDGAAT
jgi:O-antigen ligase